MIDSKLNAIIRRAGAMIRDNFHGGHRFTTKSTPFDPVTAIDREVELYLIDALTHLLPGSDVMAEETAAHASPTHLQWVVDPIDGTVNFIHRFPFVCVSVALLENGDARLGVVYNPILDEYFYASRGEGAYLNGEPLHVGACDDLAGCLLATGFPYDFATCKQNNMRYFEHFHRRVQGIRRPGSAALDLCYVAAGVFDGFWEFGLQPWDVAAGKLIVEEAGGVVTDLAGERYRLGGGAILAAGPATHALMLDECRKLSNGCEAT